MVTKAGQKITQIRQTAVELAAGVTPTNTEYEPGDVRRYGVVGDGSTDDSTALQSAIDACEGADYTFEAEPNTSYAIATALSSTGDIVMNWNGATLIPAATINGLIVNPGANLASTSLNADAQIHSNALSVTSATSITAGALIEIVSDQAWYYDPSPSEGMLKGELHVVKSISGTDVTTEDALSDNYDAVGTEAVTVNVLQRGWLKISDLSIVYASATVAVGLQLQNIVDARVCNVKIDGAQTQGINLVNCYNVVIDTPTIKRANRVGFGYGIQINESAHCRVTNGQFLGCRRGVDFSGVYPTRYCTIESNHCDGSGLQSDLGDNFDDASGFGSHETSEHNIYRNNTITHVQVGVLIRGANEVVEENYFYGDLKNACILSNKGTNLTVQNNTYSANLRPEKTLDVVATDDDQQKCPWFIRVVDPPNDVGFFKVLNNTCDDLKNALVEVFVTLASQTLKNFTVKGNVVNLFGSTLDTEVFILHADTATGSPFTLEDSVILDNVVFERTGATLTEYDSDITIDYASTCEIDNYLLPDTVLTETTSGSEANITRNSVYLQLTVRDGRVSITGWVDFDINAGTAPSVVQLQNLPNRSRGGNYTPSQGWPFIPNVATGSVGLPGMIAGPFGTPGSANIQTGLWLSYGQTAYNTVWPIGADYRVPVDVSYYTERRRA